ncbi:thioredoxin domain-containing protein [Candidatus Pacearchaeota archaeon]|nr:thioredoxin domain-containing protein [Candidatus Pacearchaeota archaeon]
MGSCLDSGKFRSEVQTDFSDCQAAEVTGTPAFFVNGQILEGAQPFSSFKQIIDEELAKSG